MGKRFKQNPFSGAHLYNGAFTASFSGT